ncbi:MAG: hypothetical protein U0031_11515 [Thermomicrobiales bacterium]
MDASRFDAWARTVGTRSGRRALLRTALGGTVALGTSGIVAEHTAAKKKTCDKKTKQKCEKRGQTCVDGKCTCDRCKGCLESCGGTDCAKFPRFEGGTACIDNVFGDCGECTSASQCDTKYPLSAGFHECLLYHGPICASVQCAKGEGRCALRCGAI